MIRFDIGLYRKERPPPGQIKKCCMFSVTEPCNLRI